MDVLDLLATIGIDGNLSETKKEAIEYAYAIHPHKDAWNSVEDFTADVTDELNYLNFGNAATDSYFTAMFASLSADKVKFDPILCSIMNHAVLELTYQTRFLGRGHNPEAFVLDGFRDPFPIFMAHGNVVFGLCISGRPAAIYEMPEWSSSSSILELNPDNLAECALSQVRDVLDVNGRTKIGVVGIRLPLDGESDLLVRYEQFLDRLDEYTSYIFYGTKFNVIDCAQKIESLGIKYESGVKVYLEGGGKGQGECAVLVVRGFESFPDIKLSSEPYKLECKFVFGRGEDGIIHEGITPISYRTWETSRQKAPFKISYISEPSEEIKHQISKEVEVHHHVVRIKNGMLVPFVDNENATYLHISEKGEVVLDYGNEMGASYRTSLWRDGFDGADGVRRSTLTIDKVVNLSGSAMPLLFAPNLHEWFSHFLIQCFPRILILEELGLENSKILVPSGLRRKQLEMLLLAGIQESNIIRMDPNVIYKADDLIVPRAWPLAFTDFSCGAYDRLIERSHIVKSRATRRILISREDRKSWRNMLNFDAVRHILVKKHGFEVIRPEKMSLVDEIDMFFHAEIVVGAEGAGLYGGCFSQPTSTFISISDEDYAMPILGSLAEIRGFKVGYVFGSSMISKRDFKRRLPYGHSDFVVDPTAVDRMVTHALTNKNSSGIAL